MPSSLWAPSPRVIDIRRRLERGYSSGSGGRLRAALHEAKDDVAFLLAECDRLGNASWVLVEAIALLRDRGYEVVPRV